MASDSPIHFQTTIKRASAFQTVPQPSEPGWCLSSWYSYLPNNNPKEHSLPGCLPDHMQPLCLFFSFTFLNLFRHGNGNVDSKKFSLFCETDWLWLRLLFCCWGNHDSGAGEGRQRGKLVYFAFTCALFCPLTGKSEKGSDPVAVSCVGSDCISSTCLMWALFKTARTMIWRQISSDWCVLKRQTEHTCARHKQSTIVGQSQGWRQEGKKGRAEHLHLFF